MSPKRKFLRELDLKQSDLGVLGGSLWKWESHPNYGAAFYLIAMPICLGMFLSMGLACFQLKSVWVGWLMMVFFGWLVVGILVNTALLIYRYIVDRRRAWAERVHMQSDDAFISALHLGNDAVSRRVALGVRHALGRTHAIDPQAIWHTDTDQSINRLLGLFNYPPDRWDFLYELWIEIGPDLRLHGRELVASMNQFGVWKANNVRDLVLATIKAVESAGLEVPEAEKS